MKQHRTLPRIKATGGGILVTAILMIAIMTAMTAAILYRVSSRHAASYMSVVWNEALSSAEAGNDYAIQALNKSFTSPSTAWTGWTPSDATTFPKTCNFNPSPHIGEGNTKVFAKITVDNTITDGSGLKWMRIRSIGVAECPHIKNGLESAVSDINGVKNHKSALRKPRFYTDITGGALRLPQITRTIETISSPPGASPYTRALLVRNTINWNATSNQSFIDSFDSSNPAYSTNGMWDASKHLSNGNIATNANGSLSNLNSQTVYGNASSNGGVLQNTEGVQGTVLNNFQSTILDIPDPVFGTVQATPTSINSPGAPVVLTGGSAASPKNYKLSMLKLTSNSSPLVLAPSAPGVETYINIWVTGQTALTGSGSIVVQPNVHVKFYSDGNVNLSGNGVTNQTNTAANLVWYGVTPTSGGSNPQMSINGSGNFIGVLNAPAFDISISGSGDYSGAAIGNGVSFNGSGKFHYDEALATLSGGNGTSTYQVASWVEDIR
ncbi:MAG: hypothetical protein ABIP85_05425 [Chthoniobacteraceae bacterium]